MNEADIRVLTQVKYIVRSGSFPQYKTIDSLGFERRSVH